MSSRKRTRNAFESQLAGAITNSATTIAIDSASGLTAPLDLVIDPDVQAKREFITVGTINSNNLESVTRGIAGSTAGAQAHDSGAVVRAVLTHQLVDAVFNDIEALESDVDDHVGGTGTGDHPEATTVVRGFMSAADKTKLNALDTALQVTNGNSHDHNGGDGAQISHANLSNLTTGDPHTMYLKEKASGGTAAETPEHDHSGSSQGGLVSVSGATVLAAWPVGSIFISTVSTNPNTLLGGGTWSAFGTGRVLVAIDAGQTEFDTVEETGGAKTHTHTQPTHTHTGPSHTHGISGTTSSNGNHDHGAITGGAGEVVNVGDAYTTGATEHRHSISSDGAHTHTFADTSSASGTGATGADGNDATGSSSSLQPYIVVHMWKRTA